MGAPWRSSTGHLDAWKRIALVSRYGRTALALAALVVGGLSAWAVQPTGTVDPTTASARVAPPSASAEEPTPSPMPSAIADATDVASVPGDFGPLEPGKYYIRPFVPDGPTIYVLFTIPVEGWLEFIPRASACRRSTGGCGREFRLGERQMWPCVCVSLDRQESGYATFAGRGLGTAWVLAERATPGGGGKGG